MLCIGDEPWNGVNFHRIESNRRKFLCTRVRSEPSLQVGRCCAVICAQWLSTLSVWTSTHQRGPSTAETVPWANDRSTATSSG